MPRAASVMKAWEHFQHETLSGYQGVGLVDGRTDEGEEEQQPYPERVTAAQCTPSQNSQYDKANRGGKINQDMHFIERAKGLYEEEFAQGVRRCPPLAASIADPSGFARSKTPGGRGILSSSKMRR